MNKTIKKLLCKYFEIPDTNNKVSLGSIGVMGGIYSFIIYWVYCVVYFIQKGYFYYIFDSTKKVLGGFKEILGFVGFDIIILISIYAIGHYAFKFEITNCERDDK